MLIFMENRAGSTVMINLFSWLFCLFNFFFLKIIRKLTSVFDFILIDHLLLREHCTFVSSLKLCIIAIHFSDKIPYLMEENHVIDDGSLDQTVPSLSSPPQSSPNSALERIERYSRKVFVGGLPPDIDEGKVCSSEFKHSKQGLHYCKIYGINIPFFPIIRPVLHLYSNY